MTLNNTAIKQPPQPPQPPAPNRAKISFGAISTTTGHRTVLYGPGGIGKTTICCHAPGKTAFIDLDESLPRLKTGLGEFVPDLVSGIDSWAALRRAFQSDGWDDVKNIVIDTLTRAEELAVAHAIFTIPHEKGHHVQRIEDYGFGKGYQFVFDTFLPLLGDLDRHCRAGRNIFLICHDCVTNVPNPAGDDWLRYEPRLQSPNSGKASVRLRVREWADHVLFMGYDVAVDKDGKGRGYGSRTVYPSELPHCMAKSRTCQSAMPVTDGTEIWSEVLK